MATTRCEECGGSNAFGTCEEHFMALLALDHSRVEPFGTFHGIVVACYSLQHPSRGASEALPGQQTIMATFLRGGIEATQRVQAAAVRRNRHGSRVTPSLQTEHEGTVQSPPFGYGIEDVSVDGTFPAEGYGDRVTRWATATVRLSAR